VKWNRAVSFSFFTCFVRNEMEHSGSRYGIFVVDLGWSCSPKLIGRVMRYGDRSLLLLPLHLTTCCLPSLVRPTTKPARSLDTSNLSPTAYQLAPKPANAISAKSTNDTHAWVLLKAATHPMPLPIPWQPVPLGGPSSAKSFSRPTPIPSPCPSYSLTTLESHPPSSRRP
jgi:hypothetical protein